MEQNARRMIQVLGTTSNAGKTTLTMAICRHLSNMGYRVSPFKSVNMSLNSVALPDGSEISRSVWLQAKAARTSPDFHMNPFLLKPEGGGKSQIIMNGRSIGIYSVKEYHDLFVKMAADTIKLDLEYLFSNYDVVVAEGAGSPAEINIMDRDFANIAVSEIWKTPALLMGDIDRGGVFASLYGTVRLMRSSDLVNWLVINNMRGDPSLLEPGITKLEEITGKKTIGVVPHLENFTLPGEDSLDYNILKGHGGIAVIRYPHMENYSEVDPLRLFGIDFFYADASNPKTVREADFILLPGSKRVDLDLDYLTDSGLAAEIAQEAVNGKRILGVCGGYQMLGKTIIFQGVPNGEGHTRKGLGLLNVDTEYGSKKITGWVTGKFNHFVIGKDSGFKGYEIHFGVVKNHGEKSLLEINNRLEGAVSRNGRIIGTNVHGLLENGTFLSYLMQKTFNENDMDRILDRNISKVSDHFMKNIDFRPVMKNIGLTG